MNPEKLKSYEMDGKCASMMDRFTVNVNKKTCVK